MVSSNRRVFACILLVLALASFTHAQKDQTASISGKVTLKDKGVAGIVVVATEVDYSGGWQRARNRGRTDEDGNYRINNVPPGNYQIYPVAPALVIDTGQPHQRLAVAAGENIRDINFTLAHGGVITGKITDADGQPLIEQLVSVTPIDPEQDYVRPDFGGIHTDDRGVYRAFGLRRGKYKVNVDHSSAILPGYAPRMFKQTFYPSVTDPEKATILEVTESSEIKDIDIVTSAPVSTFKVTGRIIHGETGKPLPNVSFGIQQIEGNSSVSSSGGMTSNSDGEFKLESLAPGRYMLFAIPRQNSDWLAEPLTVDVVDKDLTGLEIRTKRGASLEGVVVLEGSDDKTAAPKLNELFIFAHISNPIGRFTPTYPLPVNPDGSFKITGLAAGSAQLYVRERSQFQLRPLEIVSVEQNGVPQPSGINLKDGEQVGGLRIVARFLKLTGAIRGQIKFEDGELPAGNRIVVAVNPLDESSSKSRSEEMSGPPEVDSRGRFLIERLQPGTYELKVLIVPPGGYMRDDVPRQQVTVTENATTEVTVTIKLKP
jgi:protocatechuate 3,4-dioxygenase beta subunit